MVDQQSNAVILARVSSKSQEDEGYSLDSQMKLLHGYCESKGLIVARVFKIAETASKEQSRKVFHELLDYITENNINHLTVEKTDRLTRNFRDAVAIDDWLEVDDARRVHSVKENILLHKESRSDVKFMWNIHLAVAKKYTDNLREEAMKGWTEKLAQGWLPAPPPPGYMTVVENGKRVHIPDPATKSLVKRLFELYLEPSHSLATITREMDRMGVRTRGDRPYSKSNVHKMLENPFYIGVNRFNGQDYPGAQQPIISKNLFTRVQSKMHKPATVYKKHNPAYKNVIQCEGCGGVITWQIQKGRYYGCCQRKAEPCKHRKLLREDRVDEEFMKLLAGLVSPSSEIIDWVAATMREQYKTSIDHYETLHASIQAQIDRTGRMDAMLYDDKLAGEITKERYEAKHEQFVTQIAELESELSKLEKASGKRLEHRIVLLELSQRAAEIYPKKSPEQKRLIITKLFKNMTSSNGSVSVAYTNFALSIAENVRKSRQLMGEQI